MGKYVGLWHGGSSYSFGYWATDAEVFASLEHARDVFECRYRNISHMARPTHAAEWDDDGSAYVGNELPQLATPCVEGEPNLILAPLERAELFALEKDGYYAATHVIELGPRGGVRLHPTY